MAGASSSFFSNFLKKYFPYIVIFLLALYMPVDTDLGWHIRYGEYFFKTGQILRENIFSLAMAGYRWTNSSWLTDIITYSIFSRWGFLGLAIAGGLLTVLTFYLIDRALKLSFWQKAFIFPLIFYLMEPLIKVSFRGQLISQVFTACLIYIISKFQSGNKKIIYLAIPLFLIWGNLHGGFLLGLALLSMYYFLKQIKLICMKRKAELSHNLRYLPAVVFSWTVALINPWGFEVYREVIRHFGNPYQKYIIEWLPLPAFSNYWWLLIFWGIFIIFNINIIISKRRTSDYFEWMVMLAVMYFLSHWMRRYAWTMYLISVPVTCVYFEEINPQRTNFAKKAVPLIIFFSLYLYSVFYQIPRLRPTAMNWDRFCEEAVKCSAKSAEFLKENKFPGKFLSNYNWGGWLIWNYPEIVPSIDGRMHLWRNKDGYSAFAEYYFLEQNVNDIDKSDYDVVYMSTGKPMHQRLIELVNEGRWKVVYGDKYAGIFVRVTGTTEARSGNTRE